MPPKLNDTKKGQTSLFSFFKKPAAVVEQSSPPAATPQSYEIMDVVTEIRQEETTTSESPSSSSKRANKQLSGSTKKRQKKLTVDDDEEWDDSNVNQSVEFSADDASEASGADDVESDEDSDGLSDSDASDDEEEQTKKRKRVLRKSVTTKSGLPPRPTSSSKPTSSTSRSTPGGGSLSSTPQAKSAPNRNMVTPDSTRSYSPFFGTSDSRKSQRSSGADSPCGSTSSTPMRTSVAMPEGVLEQGGHEHNSFEFLFPQNRRDKAGRSMQHPDYDRRRVKVPESFLKGQTPAMEQWWRLKSENMDTVLFFKVGKFYELFHMDADIGYSELDLIYMKGAKAHSGFPEIAYGKFCNILVSKGYRVARVEQTETPEMLKERNDSASKGAKKEKVVARELCSVMSRGTRTYCHLDDLSLLDSDQGERLSASILLCIKEVHREKESGGEDIDEEEVQSMDPEDHTVPEYGVCVVDTVIGTVTLAQFQDDKQRSRLRTMVARYMPSEVLLETGQYSAKTMGVIKLLAPGAVVEALRPGSEMPSGKDCVGWIEEGSYFGASADSYPPVLRAVADALDSGSSELVLNAVGGALWQLRRSLIDYEVFSLGKIFAYIPPDCEASAAIDTIVTSSSIPAIVSQTQLFTPSQTEHSEEDRTLFSEGGSGDAAMDVDGSSEPVYDSEPRSMTLDEVALTNLEVLVNNFDRSEKGSLWAFVNRCKTAFGRRLLRSWLCHPLYRVQDIAKRRAAVDELLGLALKEELRVVRGLLGSVPDLERLLARVHSTGINRKGIDHPDSRAVLYENATYNKHKIRDFADILTGFEAVYKVGKLFQDLNVSSSLLRITLKSRDAGSNPLGRFPLLEMERLLRHFREIFDENQAKKDGNIRPRPGVDPDFDRAKADVTSLSQDLEQYLRDMMRHTGISDLKYFGSNKDRYQIEVPIGQAAKVPADWTSKSQKKTHRRYWTPVIEAKLAALVNAEERVAAAQGDTLRRIFEKFDSSRNVWSDAVSCISLLDALLALASVSALPNYVWPTMTKRHGDASPMLHVQGGRHPMLEFALSQRGEGGYIPNDLVLGGTAACSSEGEHLKEFIPKMLLLSGPNMGGKSTLLRQTCLIAILAQLGCKVPADSCTMTPVDRIFTRVGASDRILAGQSTFFVELAETATILNAATQDSLCILDELGRGTATFDGTAIAHAVVDYLVRRTRCRALFATHYHSLVDDWEVDPRVRLGHMDCMVEEGQQQPAATSNSSSGSGSDSGAQTEEVTFLYKLCDGSSPRSYGINVARLAGLPAGVIEVAMRQSVEFEERMKARMVASAAAESGSSTEGETEASFSSTQQAVASVASILSRERAASVFDKLVSIAHSAVPLEELASTVAELWRRYRAMSGR